MDDPRRPSEPGWYQDPFGTTPEDRRYWDGETWLAVQPQPTWQQAGEGQQQYQGSQWPQAPASAQHDRDAWSTESDRARPRGYGGPQTPDGVQIAGWGRRLGAYLIDVLILTVFGLIAAGVLGVWAGLSDAFSALTTATPAEAEAITEQFVQDQSGSVLMLSFISVAVSALYHIVLVAMRGRTIGKRMLGLRVRQYEREAMPSWGSASLRWLVFLGAPNLLSSLNIVGPLFAMFPLLDGLWPLWDPRRQAIHDKLARTVVVTE